MPPSNQKNPAPKIPILPSTEAPRKRHRRATSTNLFISQRPFPLKRFEIDVEETGEMQTRTVIVGNISDLAGEREVREFFSFSGDIDQLEMQQEAGEKKTAFVTFKDPKALEIALLLSGATIVDQTVSIYPVESYVPKVQEQIIVSEVANVPSVEDSAPDVEIRGNRGSGRIYVDKAHDVMTSILARGSEIGQGAVNKAKAFDEKHRLTASASTKVISFDRRVGLSEKINVGISVVNEKVKSVDQKLHVSEKTMAVLIVADKKLYDSGSSIKTSRYVSAGTAWFNGAFSKMAQAGHVAGAKTRETYQLAVSNLTAKVISTSNEERTSL